MCDQKTLDMLNATVEQFISQNQAFTGYDITLTTREREGIMLRHQTVRQDIHNLPALLDEIELGDYDATNIPSPEGGTVVLYHPTGYDISQYQFRRPTGNQAAALPAPAFVPAVKISGSADAVAAPAAPVASLKIDPPPAPKIDLAAALAATSVTLPTTTLPAQPTTSVAAPAASDGKYSLDMRGRLLIPFVRFISLGMKTGSDLFVLPKQDEKKILLSSSTFDDPMESRMEIEREGIYISSKLLRIAGLEGNFKVETAKKGEEKILEVSSS